MDPSLAMTIAPLGCFSNGRALGMIQRESQSYIHSSIRTQGLTERRVVIRRILSSDVNDRSVRAAVECYFFRNARVVDWHILRDEEKTAKVDAFIVSIRNAAQGILKTRGQK